LKAKLLRRHAGPVAERFDETLLLAIDGAGLQALPPVHKLNAAEGGRRRIPDTVRAELERLNGCSIRLYDRWRARFDELVRAQPPAFFTRLAAMRAILATKKSHFVNRRAAVNSARDRDARPPLAPRRPSR
jgi:hypothetical protein